jgi:hypothetical protein
MTTPPLDRAATLMTRLWNRQGKGQHRGPCRSEPNFRGPPPMADSGKSAFGPHANVRCWRPADYPGRPPFPITPMSTPRFESPAQRRPLASDGSGRCRLRRVAAPKPPRCLGTRVASAGQKGTKPAQLVNAVRIATSAAALAAWGTGRQVQVARAPLAFARGERLDTGLAGRPRGGGGEVGRV